MTTSPAIHIRILDLNGSRAAETERDLRRKLRGLGITAEITCIACGLEIARQGFSARMPALLMNQYLVSEGKTLDCDRLETFCRQLETWLAGKRHP